MKIDSDITRTGSAIKADGYPVCVEQQARANNETTSTVVGIVLLVLLILLVVATVIVLAWIGPVTNGDSTSTILAS